ncbi:MAG: glycoside hydrolase family 25 protein [Lachnospiraceae bacterium]|nr:glycoside hydrolase family 25 protein [Lachnospiraceae bacterium]
MDYRRFRFFILVLCLGIVALGGYYLISRSLGFSSGRTSFTEETKVLPEDTLQTDPLDPPDPWEAFARESDNAGKRAGEYSLLLSSVDHDIKMLILNDEGELEKGHAFTALLEGPEGDAEYGDFDRDGVIYASELISGEYTVSLFDERTPVKKDGKYIARVPVSVREQISYQPLADITPEIYTEAEINAAAEDTAEQSEAEEEREEETESTAGGRPDLSGGSIGIDVSKYNKDIDWNTVKKAGIEFAIIRIGYRGSTSGVLVVDPYFRKNLEGAKAAGVKVGVYFFTQAVNVTEAVEEASAVTTLVSAADLELPVFLDVEAAGGRADGLDVKSRTENINAFCRTLQNAGYSAGVYANKRWFESYIDRESLEGWKIWLARYRSSSPGLECDCWQYTSRGTVDGIKGNVDLDVNYSL